MSMVNNTSAPVQSQSAAPKPRPTISAERWSSRPTHPRLVSFSWAAVAPMGSQR